MTWTPPNRCPEGCRFPRCSHLIEQRNEAGPNDRCALWKPMHLFCGYHSSIDHVGATKDDDSGLDAKVGVKPS